MQRDGYEITVTCAQPTPMVCLLSVSEDRKADIRVAEKVFTTPVTATTTYVDSFGNHCRRLVAPSGDLTIWGDATIEDNGKIDAANFAAVEVHVAELPDSCLLYLMGSRYCETDKLSQTAWDLFGKIPPPAGGACKRRSRRRRLELLEPRPAGIDRNDHAKRSLHQRGGSSSRHRKRSRHQPRCVFSSPRTLDLGHAWRRLPWPRRDRVAEPEEVRRRLNVASRGVWNGTAHDAAR